MIGISSSATCTTISLKPDAAIRLMDSMVHLILANDEAFERGGDYD